MIQVSQRDQSTQWEMDPYDDHTYCQLPRIGLRRPSMSEKLKGDDIQFYTGISSDVFRQLASAVSALGPVSSKLSTADQLLMCLMRLRLGLLYGHLARIFEVSVSTVGNIVKTMMVLLKKVMKLVVVWLSRPQIQNSLPQSFIENGFGKTTCIVDCTEVFLQRPTKLMARAQTYSAYKGHNTIKFLTVIAPNGLLMFVSKAYGGRASDKFITADSGVQDYFFPGDEIMADRGFSLDRDLEVLGVKLNVPAFTKGISHKTARQMLKSLI